jgi:threonine/homoserine/homoserine lactone efflux protein
MESIFFLKGLIIGFAMAVPIGPIGVLCIRKTLSDGLLRGMVVGLGAATTDALFGSVAAFGLTFVSDVIARQHLWVSLLGGGLLLFLGIRTFRSRRRDSIIPFDNKGMLGSYFAACLLALTNPVTIFAFVAVFAAFGLGQHISGVSAITLVVGIFAGSSLWFLTLGYVSTHFRKSLNSGGLRWVNRVSGALIILSGCIAFASLI